MVDRFKRSRRQVLWTVSPEGVRFRLPPQLAGLLRGKEIDRKASMISLIEK